MAHRLSSSRFAVIVSHTCWTPTNTPELRHTSTLIRPSPHQSYRSSLASALIFNSDFFFDPSPKLWIPSPSLSSPHLSLLKRHKYKYQLTRSTIPKIAATAPSRNARQTRINTLRMSCFLFFGRSYHLRTAPVSASTISRPPSESKLCWTLNYSSFVVAGWRTFVLFIA
jgi:hypothetical protein